MASVSGGWKDILTIVSLFFMVAAMAASAIAWGVLMDQRGEANASRLTALETRSDARPDPFSGTEAAALEQRLQRQIDELMRYHSGN